MSSGLQKLQLVIGLKDRFSGPMANIRKRMMGFHQDIARGKERILGGAVGAAAGVMSLKSMIQPARDVKNALREVSSLDVEPKSLMALRRESLKFSRDFGGMAPDVIRSAYDIQSAISGLHGNELAKFTSISGIMAKGTKAGTAEITSYVGTMYGIFSEHADRMGKTQWLEQLAGQFGQSVKMFKTTGSGMSAAFTNIGANATAAGIKMNEQFAILGRLQATMGGGEAGTKYKAFLATVGQAQEKLGLSFADSQGKMLSMPEILGRIKGKYGEIDTVAKADIIKKAFGSDEAVALVKLLSKDIGGLKSDIASVGKASGMESITKMAKSMVDPFDQAGSAFHSLKASAMQFTLEGLEPILIAGANVMGWLTDLTQRYPTLTKYVGMATIGITALVIAVSGFAIASGMATFAMTGFSTMAAIAGGVLAVFKGVITAVRIATILWNIALYANPIGAVVGLVVLLTGAIVGLIMYWDGFRNSLANFGPIKWVIDKVKSLISLLDKIPGIDINMGGPSMDLSGTDAGKLNLGAQAESTGGAGESVRETVSNVVNSQSEQGGDRNLTINTTQEVNTRKINEMWSLGALA